MLETTKHIGRSYFFETNLKLQSPVTSPITHAIGLPKSHLLIYYSIGHYQIWDLQSQVLLQAAHIDPDAIRVHYYGPNRTINDETVIFFLKSGELKLQEVYKNIRQDSYSIKLPSLAICGEDYARKEEREAIVTTVECLPCADIDSILTRECRLGKHGVVKNVLTLFKKHDVLHSEQITLRTDTALTVGRFLNIKEHPKRFIIWGQSQSKEASYFYVWDLQSRNPEDIFANEEVLVTVANADHRIEGTIVGAMGLDKGVIGWVANQVTGGCKLTILNYELGQIVAKYDLLNKLVTECRFFRVSTIDEGSCVAMFLVTSTPSKSVYLKILDETSGEIKECGLSLLTKKGSSLKVFDEKGDYWVEVCKPPLNELNRFRHMNFSLNIHRRVGMGLFNLYCMKNIEFGKIYSRGVMEEMLSFLRDS